MPRPGQKRTSHVLVQPEQDDDRDPLPAPLTARNLVPRIHIITSRRSRNSSSSSRAPSVTSLRETQTRTSSISQTLAGTTRTSTRTIRMDSDSVSDYASSGDESQALAGPSRAGKRRRRDPEEGSSTRTVRRLRHERTESHDLEGGGRVPGPPLSASSSFAYSLTHASTADVEEFDLSGHDFSVSGTTSGHTLAEQERKGTSSPMNSPVSSASLAKILNAENVEVPGMDTGKGKAKGKAKAKARGHWARGRSKGKGKGKTKEEPIEEDIKMDITPSSPSQSSKPLSREAQPLQAQAEPLGEYTCPICFFPPTNATLTPCGHICCGSCLFTAVKATTRRNSYLTPEDNKPKCPVCRAELVLWDGKGAGVIGLKPRAILSL